VVVLWSFLEKLFDCWEESRCREWTATEEPAAQDSEGQFEWAGTSAAVQKTMMCSSEGMWVSRDDVVRERKGKKGPGQIPVEVCNRDAFGELQQGEIPGQSSSSVLTASNSSVAHLQSRRVNGKTLRPFTW
jgi:hypothetical protein